LFRWYPSTIKNAKEEFILKIKSNKTYLTADISELLTLSASAKATSVKCGV
jgi:hypothetical protein